MLDIGNINIGSEMNVYYCLYFLTLSALSLTTVHTEWEVSSKFLENYSLWTKSIPVLDLSQPPSK